jgi:voltage-gated potassium channel
LSSNDNHPSDGHSGDPGLLQANLSIADTFRPFIGRFSVTFVYFLVVFAIGAVGFHQIEGWTWFESLYMSVTTVSSVGYMEVHPLSVPGRTFAMFMIALGITGLGIWWALMTALIVELDLGGALRRRRKMKLMHNMKDHYIVCGAGRVGRMVLREIHDAGHPLVVVEKNEDRARRLEEDFPDLLVLAADSTKERVLTEARIDAARGLAACLADDGDNLLVCLTARHLNPQLATVARAFDEESVDRLRHAGADHVIAPTLTGGIRMASTLLRPHVVSFLDSAIVGAGLDLRLEEATLPEGSPLAGRTLADARIPQTTGLVVIAIQKDHEGRQTYNPGPQTVLAEGDVMIVLGERDQVEKLRKYARTG